MALLDILQQLFGGGAPSQNRLMMAAQGPNAEDRPGFMPTGPQWGMAGRQNIDMPVMPHGPQSAPQAAQIAPSQASQPGFLERLINPNAGAENKTLEWLGTRGFSPEQARVVMGDKGMLQQVLRDYAMPKEADPLDSLRADKMRIEIAQGQKALNAPDALPQDVEELDLRAQRMGLTPGSKEYIDFFRSGGGNSGVTVNIGDQANERAAAAVQYGLDPNSPEGRAFILTGKMPREDQQELTATDKKALWAAEDELPIIDNTLDSLNRAKELNGKTFTGVGSDLRGWLGTAVPGGGYLVDEETAQNTAEFGKLMSMEAIQQMASTLKGATTDSELARFVNILADPSTSPEIRGRTIDRMMALANRVRETKTSRINSIKGSTQRSAPVDVREMSDEELRALANGQ